MSPDRPLSNPATIQTLELSGDVAIAQILGPAGQVSLLLHATQSAPTIILRVLNAFNGGGVTRQDVERLAEFSTKISRRIN